MLESPQFFDYFVFSVLFFSNVFVGKGQFRIKNLICLLIYCQDVFNDFIKGFSFFFFFLILVYVNRGQNTPRGHGHPEG